MESKEKHLERYYNRKKWSIEYLGGECKKCKSTLNLQFDHISPECKKCNVTKMLLYSLKKLTKELNKCQLLCHECHLEKSKIDAHRNPAKGSRVGTSKLIENDVIEIKKRLKKGDKMIQIAETFNISYVTIRFIRSGRLWKHI